MEFIEQIFGVIGDLTWGWALIPFLVVLGVFFTIVSGFVQFKYFKRMFRVLSGKNQSGDPNAITAREALLLSVGGRVGGGNIAGVAVAITLGGPGAVFWMWAIAIVGMATSLVECSLAQLFKERQEDGSFRGGPARFITKGLGEDYRWLAILYAICLIAAFGIGFPAFQGNTVAGAAEDSLGLDRLITGIVLTVGTGFIVYGGIHRIAKACDVIVPIMALTYIAMALVVIVLNIGEVPRVFGMIIANAFGFEEAVGGGMGAAIAQGLRRGLFSNEAGLGSAPNVAATADVRHPISQGITQSFSVFIDTIIIANAFGFEEAVGGGMGAAIAQGLRRGLFSNEAGLGSAPNVAATADVRHPISQGITQSFSVFIDTIIICSCTAFVILLGDVYVAGAQDVNGVALTQQSLVSHLGAWVQYFLTFAVLLFAFSSIIYNYYLGENALTFMTDNPAMLHVFRIALMGIVLLGAIAPGATSVFFFSDPMMGILAVVNLLALLMLFPIAKRLINDFGDQVKAGVDRPVLDPAKFDDLELDRTAWTGKVD